ncbi:MAG: ferrous iron transport protein A [Oscillospiraceae bacterium]|nr:ferrous iron transport protein A [Oscillospiraceae bacterium]MBQ8731319.1 ferrous iron transport protein A [Oscillospiraceae bacterium]
MEAERCLSQLGEGQSGIVDRISAEGRIRRRLQDIGLIEGAEVVCVRVSPLGDPVAYAICGAVIALRREDARQVTLRREAGKTQGGRAAEGGRPWA